MKTVLITGAAGFIGSNLSKKLLDSGDYRVVGVDNLDDTYDKKHKEQHIEGVKKDKNFSFHEEDVRGFDEMKEIFEKESPDYVIHLAAKADTRRSVKEPYEYESVNILGTLNMLELAKEFDVTNFVFASSSSVYGNDATVPFLENDPNSKPISPYGATKVSGEYLVYTYHHNFGLNSVCLRFFNAYGENNRPGMVPYVWTEKILRGEEIEISGDGSRKRDYTYVGDTVDAIILAMKAENIGYEVINVGYGKPYSLNELLVAIESATGMSASVKSRPSHPASVEETYADTTRAKEVLGWEPKIALGVGIERLVIWFRANRL